MFVAIIRQDFCLVRKNRSTFFLHRAAFFFCRFPRFSSFSFFSCRAFFLQIISYCFLDILFFYFSSSTASILSLTVICINTSPLFFSFFLSVPVRFSTDCTHVDFSRKQTHKICIFLPLFVIIPFIKMKKSVFQEVKSWNTNQRGVCSRLIIHFDIVDNKVRNVSFVGGCSGNLQGISPHRRYGCR